MGFGQEGIHGTANASLDDRNMFIQVPSLKNIVDICAGAEHALALDANNHLYIWGLNLSRQCGKGSVQERKAVVSCVNDSGELLRKTILQIGATQVGSVILTGHGVVYTCGGYQTLGNGSSTPNENCGFFQPISFNDNSSDSVFISRVFCSASSYHVFAQSKCNTLFAWGLGEGGELCNGSSINAFTPIAVHQVYDVSQISDIQCGTSFTLILMIDGSVFICGSLGQYYKQYNLALVQQFNCNVKQISAGGWHALVLTDDASVYCWGSNEAFQLGSVELNDTVVYPQQSTIFSPASVVQCGYRTTFVLSYNRSESKFLENVGLLFDMP